ncbi:uncharacterized protein LOC113495204 [Trichoplusia ni]|uniref:Uncharacterized protein LOC113495204 n=1 Tax=Trichoplusia ni TaxID=7111 RepID=A0A7E5VMU5_TRINI|nr:uncharacterized protein LOC113495204 [Trichoplusia ni]
MRVGLSRQCGGLARRHWSALPDSAGQFPALFDEIYTVGFFLHSRISIANMCEWLSYGEWCDVKLLCGGRAFSAHRAVLASVSNFLRRILLSCPLDESPTFIVLPDFDLDAMSSVLYYIYNGEVVVKKDKIEMFLDIINAMQIFIDSQYLSKIADKVDSHVFENSIHTDLSKERIFTLGLADSDDQQYVNLKKGKIFQDVSHQYSKVNKSDCDDKLVRTQNPSGENKTSLGHLKSPYEDRQRNSFLRDLYIETYPRNGNVNGLTAGVLAISNECYRAPASVLLTNANGKHLNDDDILLKPHKKANEHISHSPTVFHLREQQRCTRDEPDNCNMSKTLYDPPSLSVCSVKESNNKRIYGTVNKNESDTRNVWVDHSPMTTNPLFQFGLQERILSGLCVPSLDFTFPSMLDSMKPLQAFNNKSVYACTNSGTRKEIDTNSSTKVTILNHVLESPWSPRMPNNYKPFRRKSEHSKQSQIRKQNENETRLSNDNNNNFKISSLLNKNSVTEEEPVGDTKELLTAPLLLNRTDDFKCTLCNQVFTSSEYLAVHMRRHSATARYTCGECGKTFSQLRNFKYHMSIHRGTREFAATCTVCGKYFNDRGYLSSHMKIHRNRKEYKCTLCPKSFNQRVAYNMHVRIHTGVKPHVCSECGKAFSRKMLLKQHQRTHSGERPYACPHCDKRFADRSNMTLHLRLHTGVKPFSCTLCPKSFTKKHHLKSHLNFHTGSKPYSCPRCKLAFTQSSNMRTHLKKCRAPETADNETTSTMTSLEHSSDTKPTENSNVM